MPATVKTTTLLLHNQEAKYDFRIIMTDFTIFVVKDKKVFNI